MGRSRSPRAAKAWQLVARIGGEQVIEKLARTRTPIDSSCFVLQPGSPDCLLLIFFPLCCAGHPSPIGILVWVVGARHDVAWHDGVGRGATGRGATGHGATGYGMTRHGATGHRTKGHGMTGHGMTGCGMAGRGATGHSMAAHGSLVCGVGVSEWRVVFGN